MCIAAFWVGEINGAQGLCHFSSKLTNVSLTEKLKVGYEALQLHPGVSGVSRKHWDVGWEMCRKKTKEIIISESMWNFYLIAMQFPDDFFHFTATCACKYEKRHSWREVVPSHAGPLGFERAGVTRALTCLILKPKLRNLGWIQSSTCICSVQLGLCFGVVGFISKLPPGLFQQGKQRLRKLCWPPLAQSWRVYWWEVTPFWVICLQKTKFIWFMTASFCFPVNI